MNKVAIAILNYNGKNLLEQFLPSVIKYSNGYPIYIIDNASTDDSIEFIKRQYPAIETILLSENYGYSGGYNQGLLKINATYFILLNSDIEVTENWIGPIISLLEDNDQIAACQPKILSFLEKDKFEYAGAAGGFIDTLGYPFCRGRIFDKVETDLGQYDDTREIFWATGACLFMRSSAFQESGGFDEDFFAHMEEIDLCWRLQHLGYKIFYNHQSTVYHLGGGTLKKSNPFKTYLNFRNSLYTLYKNASFISLFWKLPLRWILDLLAV